MGRYKAVTKPPIKTPKTTITVGVIMGGYGKESNIGTWLIVTPIVLAVLFALFIPAVRRRRAADNPSPAV